MADTLIKKIHDALEVIKHDDHVEERIAIERSMQRTHEMLSLIDKYQGWFQNPFAENAEELRAVYKAMDDYKAELREEMQALWTRWASLR